MRAELEKIKIGIMLRISDQLLDSRVEIIEDYLSRDIEAKLTGYLWGEHQPDIHIEYPRDWWQAFKERWFPKWLIAKYPVIKKYHTLRRNIVYPKLKISMPLNTHRLICDYAEGVKIREDK